MTAPLSNKKLSTKNIVHSIKLSIRLFQGGMRDSGLKTCGIGKLDGTYAITRSTLFLEETWETQLFIRQIRQINLEKIKINPINIKARNKVVWIVDVSYWHSTFVAKTWSPKALCSWVPIFGAKSWIPKTLNSWPSTFNIKSWKPRTLGSWSSIFGVESWRPFGLLIFNFRCWKLETRTWVLLDFNFQCWKLET